MKIIVYALIFSYVLLFSCKNEGQQRNNTHTDTLSYSQPSQEELKDTTIIYNIEGISSDGAEAEAKYIKGKIEKCTIKVYGETGQAELTYTFLPSQIDVTEKEFRYKEDLQSANSNGNMRLKYEIKYSIDYNGKPLGTAAKERIDIFKEIQSAVPFTLGSVR